MKKKDLGRTGSFEERSSEISESSNKKNGRTQNVKDRSVKVNLVNVQGLTRSKLLELEGLLKTDCDIMCLTETQQKFEKYEASQGITMVESMREIKDKKGGGLRIMIQNKQGTGILKQRTCNPDILHATVEIGSANLQIVLVYLSVSKTADDRERNKNMKAEIDKILEAAAAKDEALLLLGDMNGHIGQLGYQKEDENGRIVIDWINQSAMILLNLEEFCLGTYTWSRHDQKSTIDYVLANRRCYQWIESMMIDEGRELYDLSDHHMISVQLKIQTRNQNFNKGMTTVREFWKVDENSLQLFGEEMQKRLQNVQISSIEKLNELMTEVADTNLKARYRKKILKEQQVKEMPWVTDEIRQAIKKRKAINREKRNTKDKNQEKILNDQYKAQKKKAQILVKEAVTKSERKATEDIRNSANKSKSMFENIDKLRKKERSKADIQLYDGDGKKLTPEEEQEQLVSFWKTVYQQHPNNISEVWNEDIKNEYEERMQNEVRQGPLFPRHLRELMDMALPPRREIATMEPTGIDMEDVKRGVMKMKNRTAPGPDQLKPELYKALITTEKGLETLTRCMQQELNATSKPESWKTSKTKMIPKSKKPMAKDLRPIALTNISYKLFMSILKDKIERHLKDNDEMLEVQAGFTSGGKVEDNLFILRYCVEDSFRRKKPLFLTAIDYKKAFDSVDRAEMVEAMKLYKIDPKIIDATAQIYQGDSTTIKLNDRTEAVIDVTSGIRQGCNGSTTSFKIITYVIAKALTATGLGFKNDTVHIPVLLFADDGLVLTQTLQETEHLLTTLADISGKLGLQINRDKSAILIFNCKDQPQSIVDIPVVEQIKYLGVTVVNKKKLYKEHINGMLQKAQKMANMTFGITQRCCNRLMIGKCYWKCLALPSFLYGASILSLTDAEVRKLQVCENGVYRQILRAPKYSPICTIRGEVGTSLMKTRVMTMHLQFLRGAMQGSNDLIRKIAREELEVRTSTWARTTRRYFETLGLNTAEVERMSKPALKKRLKEWDDRQWSEELEAKTSVNVYRSGKGSIKEDPIYDNTAASTVLFQARTNTLPLGTRKRRMNTGETATCALCGEADEDQFHFMLECTQLAEERMNVTCLQRPHLENAEEVVTRFLFSEHTEEMEENKEGLFKLWRLRSRKMATATGGGQVAAADTADTT